MIRYRYNQQVTPAAPFVHVNLRTPDGKRELIDLPAQLDTGADKTVLPSRIVEALGLLPTRDVPVMGFGGLVTTLPGFLVQASVRQLNPAVVEALSSRNEPYVLLGRDVLNQYRLLLDGPHSILEIE